MYKYFFKSYALITPLLVSFVIHSEEILRPNILFIMSDDHTKQAISAYGSKLIETFHFDRIAKEGAIFQKIFFTNTICAPSRAEMLTGKHSQHDYSDELNQYFLQKTLDKIEN